jgi:hypothetical protein
VLDGLGCDGGGAFLTEFDPGLDSLLLLGHDGCGHPTVPRVGSILDS